MPTVTVSLNERTYPIYVEADALHHLSDLLPKLGQEIMVVTNETVAQWYLKPLMRQLSGRTVVTTILKDGEQYKTLASFEQIMDQLIQHRLSRSATIIALGGGVIGDIAGFAAACYQRGIQFIQVPTTLLAQVDASVGGKTAVNHPHGKNMIGAFHQPQAVITDINTLDTLPQREFSAGLAEVMKHALIADPIFFDWLINNQQRILKRDKPTLGYMIQRCCEIKARIVAQDEHESSLRATLNFGHTIGHAIETNMGYGELLHGEAVSIGLCLALQLSVQELGLAAEIYSKTTDWLQKANLPISIPLQCKSVEIIEAIQQDKKKVGSQLRFVLLKQLGQAIISDEISPAQLLALIEV